MLLFGISIFFDSMEGRRSLIKEIAKERIEILFGLAEKQKDAKLVGSYLSIMKRIQAHYKVGLPSRIKNRMCSGCGALLMPGLNCTTKIASSRGYVIYRCRACGAENHVRYKKWAR